MLCRLAHFAPGETQLLGAATYETSAEEHLGALSEVGPALGVVHHQLALEQVRPVAEDRV